MLTLVCGPSCSGKDTLVREMEKSGFTRIVADTTRPKRDGEVDGLDYNFLTPDEFMHNALSKRYSSVTRYREWNYGLRVPKGWKGNRRYVAIVSPADCSNLESSLGDFWNEKNVELRYLGGVGTLERLARSIKRDGVRLEAFRRAIADARDFSKFCKRWKGSPVYKG